MAVNAIAVWRVRPSGANTNGGGFDVSLSSAATGTHGSYVNSTTKFTDATAAAFTSGMVGSSIFIQMSSGSGQYLIASFIDASNITLGPGTPAMDIAGPLTWTVGGGTDYSQQNGFQVNGTNGSGVATTTFTDATAANFTAAMVGNCINIAGQGFYFVTSFTNASNVVVDRALGTFSGASWALGGGWADFFTNTPSTPAALVAGNIVYLLGSQTPNSASYTYDYTYSSASDFTPTAGSSTAGFITFANDPATPGYRMPPDTTGGMPTIRITAAGRFVGTLTYLSGLWFVGGGTASTIIATSSGPIVGCVVDGFNQGTKLIQTSGQMILGCEVFNAASGGGQGAIQASGGGITIIGCNMHDNAGYGINFAGGGNAFVSNCIVSKCTVGGIQANVSSISINNCTIDGNSGHGIEIDTQAHLQTIRVINCIISNQTGVGKAGISVAAGSAVANDKVGGFFDYNTYFNNTADVSGINYGPHDTYGGSNPYVGQATENYTLA